MLVLLATFAGGFLVSAREQGRVPDMLATHWAGRDNLSPDERLHVVLVLQPHDCFQSVEMLQRFSSLMASADIDVHGLLAIGRNGAGLIDSMMANEMGITFPLEPVNVRHLAMILRAVGIRETPVIALVDGLEQVRYLAPLNALVMEDEADRVIRLLRELEAQHLNQSEP